MFLLLVLNKYILTGNDDIEQFIEAWDMSLQLLTS